MALLHWCVHIRRCPDLCSSHPLLAVRWLTCTRSLLNVSLPYVATGHRCHALLCTLPSCTAVVCPVEVTDPTHAVHTANIHSCSVSCAGDLCHACCAVCTLPTYTAIVCPVQATYATHAVHTARKNCPVCRSFAIFSRNNVLEDNSCPRVYYYFNVLMSLVIVLLGTYVCPSRDWR